MNVNKQQASEANGLRRGAAWRRTTAWAVALVLAIALALMLQAHADSRAAVACAGRSVRAA